MPKQEFLTPAVSEQTYNSLSMDQKIIFDLIVSSSGGIASREIKKQTRLDDSAQRQIVRELTAKGIAIRATETGIGRRYFYSPYAADHKIRTNGGNA